MRMRGDMAMREHLGVQSIGRCQAPDVLRRLLDDTLCAHQSHGACVRARPTLTAKDWSRFACLHLRACQEAELIGGRSTALGGFRGEGRPGPVGAGEGH